MELSNGNGAGLGLGLLGPAERALSWGQRIHLGKEARWCSFLSQSICRLICDRAHSGSCFARVHHSTLVGPLFWGARAAQIVCSGVTLLHHHPSYMHRKDEPSGAEGTKSRRAESASGRAKRKGATPFKLAERVLPLQLARNRCSST